MTISSPRKTRPRQIQNMHARCLSQPERSGASLDALAFRKQTFEQITPATETTSETLEKEMTTSPSSRRPSESERRGQTSGGESRSRTSRAERT